MTDKVLSPSRLAHVVLRTPNFKSMVAFYKTFLGAHASWENDHLAFLTYDEEHHRIAIAYIPGTSEKIRSSAGLEHVAFTFDTLQDLVTAYKQRKSRGIFPFWSINHGPTTSMYYQDPDGNQIETQVDNFDTAEEVNAFMSGPDFDKNPLGVDFDPEDLIMRLDRGEDEKSIKKRGDIGPRGIESIPQPGEPVKRESYDVISQ